MLKAPTAPPISTASNLVNRAPNILPSIRVRTLDSLKEANNQPKLPVANSPRNIPPKILRAIAPRIATPTSKAPDQVVNKPANKPANKPINFGNGNGNIVIVSKPNVVSQANAPAIISKQSLGQAVITKVSSSQPAVKLWNNVIQKGTDSTKSIDLVVVSNKRSTNDDNSTFSLKPTKEVVENAKENSSVLKIDQVYECVSDDFVEDLLVEKATQPAQVELQSPLLDSLVMEIGSDTNKTIETQTARNPKQSDNPNAFTLVQPTEAHCSDFRCNICLEFTGSLPDFKRHMLRTHGCMYSCEKCHSAFPNHAKYKSHFRLNGVCNLNMNSARNYISIVDPPIILMKNEKVFAFKCKHCQLAFHTQKIFVQHAQRHARLFRCKKCPTKPLTIRLMKDHLKHHAN